MKHIQSSAIPHHTKNIVKLMRRLAGLSVRLDCRDQDVDAWSRIENYREFSQAQLAYLEPKLQMGHDHWRSY